MAALVALLLVHARLSVMQAHVLLAFFFSHALSLVQAVRVTVDDSNTTQWSYSGSWVAVTPLSPCTRCLIQPDLSNTFNHTHHQTTDPQGNAGIAFTGTTVEVYAICPANLPGVGHYETNFTFTLDGVADGAFCGPQPYCKDFIYNYLVYARSNLTLKPHFFSIVNTPHSDEPNSLETAIVLDYAIYENGIDPTPNPVSVVGGLLLLVLAA